MIRAIATTRAIIRCLLLIVCFSLIIGSLKAQDYASLTVLNPQQQWNRATGAIDEAIITVRPRGIYLEYGVFLTFSAKGSFFMSSSYSRTNLEVVMNFSLPQNALVTDSWLWVGDSVMRAQILDRWTASNIYEGIVNRNRDPSILTKNGNAYELRVFPMLAPETRKVKITYLVPVTWSATSVSAPLPTNLLLSSAVPLKKFTMLVWEKERWRNMRINEMTTSQFTRVRDAVNGDYQRSELTFSTAIPSSLTLAFDSPAENGVFVNLLQNGNEGFYQMAVLPSEVFADRLQSRKIAIALDYDPTKTSNFSLQQLLANLKTTLQTTFSPRDSFNIVYSWLAVQRASERWMPMDAATIERTFQRIGMLSLYSNLPSVLAESVKLASSTDANVLLVTNTDQFANTANANQLLRDLQGIGGTMPRITIADLYDQFGYSFVNNQYYFGNAYLYTNLARISGGSYYSRRSYALGSYVSLTGTSQNVLTQTSQAVNGANITSLDLYTSMKNGFCYGRYSLTNQGVMQGASGLGGGGVVLQTGKFTGTVPFVLNMSGFVSSRPATRTIELMPNQMERGDSFAEQVWAGNYIRSQETSSSLPNAVISDIIASSVRNRVLSNYTAFLALEPNDTLRPCVQCDVRADIAPSGRALTSVKDEVQNGGVNFSASPNPFTTDITLEIALAEGLRADQCELSVINVLGQEIMRFDVQHFQGQKTIRMQWSGLAANGAPVPKGMYFVVLKTPSARMVWKIMKIG